MRVLLTRFMRFVLVVLFFNLFLTECCHFRVATCFFNLVFSSCEDGSVSICAPVVIGGAAGTTTKGGTAVSPICLSGLGFFLHKFNVEYFANVCMTLKKKKMFKTKMHTVKKVANASLLPSRPAFSLVNKPRPSNKVRTLVLNAARSK